MMRGRSGKFTIALVPALLVLLLAQPGVSQQVPQQLTLEEAQRLARLYNPDYRSAENDATVAAARVRQQYGNLLPTLSTSLGFNGDHSWTQRATDEFGRPIQEVRTVESERSSASQSIGMSMTLFDGGARFRNIASARAAQQATEARIAANANQLRAQVGREYFGALRAQHAIALEERLLAARKDDLERTQKQLAVAASKYIDVLSARVAVASAEQSLDRAKGEAEKARLVLKQTMGVDGAADFGLTAEPPAAFDATAIDVNVLVTRALEQSPSVLAAIAALSEADQASSTARAARWPSISGSLGFGRGTSANGYGAFGEFDLPNRGFSFGVSASLPLFRGFSTTAAIAQADASELDSREGLRRVRLAAEREMRSAVIDLRNAQRTVQLAQQKAELSRERLSMAQEEYRMGASGMDFFRLQQIVNEEAQSQRDLLDARFAFVNAVIALEERLGGPLER